MFLGWASFAGTELINNNRAAAYATLGVLCTCSTLPDSLGHDLYVDPVSDPAPWYDPAIPESKEFHGIVGLEINGASTSTLTTQWTETITDGGVSGVARRESREVEFKVMLLAGTDAGRSYGLEWLASTLRGSTCREGCIGDTLCLYSGCPQAPLLPDPDRPDDGCGGGGSMPDPDWQPYEGGNQAQRTLYDVSLLEYADDLEFARPSGAWTATVTFTLKAGEPPWYRQPVTVIDSQDEALNPPWRDTIPSYDMWRTPACPPQDDCLFNPYCAERGPWGDEPFPGSDPRDPVWVDPCYPTEPFTAQRAIYTVPAAWVPGWLERVPLVELYTGSQAVHRITIRWYANKNQRPPGPQLDPCDICNEITVPWLPPRTRVTFDGRTRRVLAVCADNHHITSDLTLYGPYGQLLQWPVFDCATGMHVEVLCKAGTWAADATYRHDWVPRGDAI